VANCQYYCEVRWDSPARARGVYTFSSPDNRFATRDYEIIRHSDYVWRQGPMGGVKIVKDRGCRYPVGYITNSKKYMEQFMWIKLQAKELD